MEESAPNAKVQFLVEQEDGTKDVETPWATSLGDDLFRIENSLFFAYGVSWLDIVSAPYHSEHAGPVFEKVVEKSGHSTIRAILEPAAEEGNASQKVLDDLVCLGASYEGFSSSYIAIDVPAEIELALVCNFLTESGVEWEYADPTYNEVHPDAT